MFTYLVQVSDSCKNLMQNQNEIRQIVKEVINKNVVKNSDQFKNILEIELANVFENNDRRISIDSMYRMDTPKKISYFVTIMMRGKKPLMLFVEYKDMCSLKEIAAWEISKQYDTIEHLNEFFIKDELPIALKSVVEKYLEN